MAVASSSIWESVKDKAKRAEARAIGVTVAMIAEKVIQRGGQKTDKELVQYTRKLADIAPIKRHKILLSSLAGLFEQNHPSLQTFRRILSLHPNYKKKIFKNLLGNCVLRGELLRQKTMKQYGCAPFLVVISPTMRCNLNCLGCYAGQYPRNEGDPIPFEVMNRAVTEAKQMGIYFFTISGGEPFARKDLLDLYEAHPDATFQIYTNGTLIDDETIERMQKAGNIAPAISVEGSEQATNARRGMYRGRPVWTVIMETMGRLREAGIMFGFSGTAMRTNAELYLKDEFYDLMVEKGCLFGWVFIFVPVGKDDTMELMITAQQRDKLRANILEVRRKWPLFVADFWNDGCLTGGCMSGGTLYFHINYRGDIEPCVFMHFATENIIDLYKNGGQLGDVFNTPFFKEVRRCNRNTNPLQPCPIIDHNRDLINAVNQSGALPTHEGAEHVITTLSDDLIKWSKEYDPFVERAWNSGDYDWAKEGKNIFLTEE